jgi:hypothetical protein
MSRTAAVHQYFSDGNKRRLDDLLRQPAMVDPAKAVFACRCRDGYDRQQLFLLPSFG